MSTITEQNPDVETLEIIELHLMFEADITCEYCENPAAWLWTHNTVNPVSHITCDECKRHNDEVIAACAIRGKYVRCMACQYEFPIQSITVRPI